MSEKVLWVCPFCGGSDIELVGRQEDLLYQCNGCSALANAHNWCDWDKWYRAHEDMKATLAADAPEPSLDAEVLRVGSEAAALLDRLDRNKLDAIKLFSLFHRFTSELNLYLRNAERSKADES